jgi:hypothetical protein
MSLLSVPAPLRDFRLVRNTKEVIRLMVRNQTAADCLSRVWPLQADAAFLRCPRSSRQLAGGWRLAYARDRNSGTANKRRIALPRGQSVTLARNRSLDSNIASYTLNYGTKEGRPSQSLPVGNVTTATIGNLNDATSYYFTVRPINRMGFESLPSNEVAHRTPDAAASRLTVNNGSGSGNYIAGTIVTVSSNPPPSGKAFDRWLNDWIRYESQTLEPCA